MRPSHFRASFVHVAVNKILKGRQIGLFFFYMSEARDMEDIYYMAARGHEFSLRVLKVSLTRSLRSLVRDTFSTRRQNSYPQVATYCSVYFIDTDEIPT